MATTSPDNLRTPDPGDPYNLVADLATLAGDVQSALNTRANSFKGTASERIAFASIAVDGMLWQDTDGIKMIWRRDSSVAGNWTPAVTRWIGTAAQMNAFTQAPVGFEWYNSSNALNYIKFSSGWQATAKILTGRVNLTPPTGGGMVETTVPFPSGFFTSEPLGFATVQTGITGAGVVFTTVSDETVNGMKITLNRTNGTPTNIKWQAVQL